MNIQEAKRQRRLRRIYNQIRHGKRLRIAKEAYTKPVLTWWERLIRYIKSFLNAKSKLTN